MRTTIITLAITATLFGCRLTDHDDGGHNTVTPSDIHIPASGYAPMDSLDLPRFAFDSISLDMGNIAQGEVVQRTFRFKNVGKRDLVITDVHGSCGCTVAKSWPKQPLRPGEGGEITVTFDSEGKHDRQEKVVSVRANTYPPTTALFLHGNVIAPGAQTK